MFDYMCLQRRSTSKHTVTYHVNGNALISCVILKTERVLKIQHQ